MRLIFTFFLFGHALFHALGFMRVFDLGGWAELEQAPIAMELGIFWLCASILYLTAGYGFAARFRRWWMAGFSAVLVSQTLVIVEWDIAAWGTLPNIFIFLVCFISYMNWRFEITTLRETDALKIMVKGQPDVEPSKNDRTLPPIVVKWMDWSGARNASIPKVVSLHQSGELRLKKEGKWIPFRASQWFSPGDPGFIWLAKVGEGGFLQFMGRDKYIHGKGNMLIKAYGTFKVADESGPEMDKASAVRFLSEMIWFPQFVHSDLLSWEEINSHSARVVMNYRGRTEGVFHFREDGRPTAFEAIRFNSDTGREEVWQILIEEEGTLEENGIRIPSRGKVIWKFDALDFHWLSLDVNSIDYHLEKGIETEPKILEPPELLA